MTLHPWERDDLHRTIKLVLWLAPRDNLAVALRRLADKIEVSEVRRP